MESQMEKLTIGDKANPNQFAPKKLAGKLGTPVEVLCNAVKIEISKNVPLYKYDVLTEIVFPATDGKGAEKTKSLTKGNKQDSTQVRRRELAVMAYKKVLNTYPAFFKGPLFYDRQAVIFSVTKLAVDANNAKSFEIPVGDIYPNKDAKCIRLTVKQVEESFQVTTDQKSIVSASKPGASDADKTLLEALNIIISTSSYTNTDALITYGNNVSYLLYPEKTVFDNSKEVAQSRVPAILPTLSACKYTGVGVSKAVKALEGDGKPTLYAFTDIKKTPFYQDGCSFLDLLSNVSKDANLSRKLNEGIDPRDPAAVQLLRSVKGLGLRLNYDKKGVDGRLITVHGFGPRASSKESEFYHEADKKTYTISAYFKNVLKYDMGRGLKYPNMFTVYDRYDKKIRYPAEVLIVAENQRVPTTHLTPIEQGTLVKAAATLPQKRLEQTDFMKNACKINTSNKDVASCGLQLTDSFTKVAARVLPAPTIKFGGNKTLSVQNNVKWDSASTRFIDPKTLTNWQLIAIRSESVDQFGKNLVRRAQELGMKVAPPTFLDMSNAKSAEIEGRFVAAKAAKVEVLFFVINQNINLHNEIKLFEQKYDVLTQEVKALTASKTMQGQRQTMDNIICKLNMKLGGLNYGLLGLGGKASVTSAPGRLIFGFEKSHAAPHSDQPSVLGWSANIGKQPEAFSGGFLFYDSKNDDAFLEILKNLIPLCCKEFRKNRNNAAPNDLLFYFNGVSEGQFAEVRDRYANAILAGLKALSEAYKPGVTLLVVSKSHNERFYKTNIPGGAKAPEQNITPGTVIDTKVVSAALSEFFLNAHSAIQGTAATPKYSLVFTTPNVNFTSDQIQELTYHLTFMHEIVSSATALPVPLVVADRYAKRGHNNYLTSSLTGARSVASGDSEGYDIEQLNASLTYNGKTLDLTRYNA